MLDIKFEGTELYREHLLKLIFFLNIKAFK